MKYIKSMIVAVSMLYLSNLGFAQKPTLQMGLHIPPDEASKSNFSLIIAGNKDEFLVADLKKDWQHVITSYNSTTLAKNESFVIDCPKVNGICSRWTKYLFHNDMIISIYGFCDKVENENIVYGKITDRKGNILRPQQTLMKWYSNKPIELDDVIVKWSSDNTKLLIMRQDFGKLHAKRLLSEIQFAVYDNEFDKLAEKTFLSPYPGRKIVFDQTVITNEGYISIVASLTSTKEEINDNPSLEKLPVMKIFVINQENGGQLQEIKIEGNNNLRTCSGVYSDSLHSMLYAGFFSDSKLLNKESLAVDGIILLDQMFLEIIN